MDTSSVTTKNAKLVCFDYIRALAVFMILYDHIGAFRNSEWAVKKAIDFFICTPLDIIQDFGAFGVSLFLIISGFLFTFNGKYEKIVSKRLTGIRRIYISSLISFLGFWLCQFLVNLFVNTYWGQFTPVQWIESMTLVGYFTGNGDVINGTTWFLIPLFLFYLISIIYGIMQKKIGVNALWLIEAVLVVLFAILYFVDQSCGSIIGLRFVFVFMPVSGMILGELYKNRDDSQKRPGGLFLLLLINFFLQVVAIYLFDPIYYAMQHYLVSYMYSFLIIAALPLFEKYFKESKAVNFICRISLAIYLLQMTWGGFIMQLFYDIGLPFTISFIMTITIIILLSYFHNVFFETKLMGLLFKRRKNA